MSHRVTTKTEITDREMAIAALNRAKYSFTSQGNTLTITSGPLNRAIIDLTTGEVTGDTNYHGKDSLGLIRQVYSEEKYVRELRRIGASITSREVLRNGDIKLTCCHG